MLSVNDMFYNDKQEPVLVVGQSASDRSRSQYRRGFLARQDSRNFRSSASPPPSRSDHHASSWFGHRKSSQSPPRSRHHDYEAHYNEYRNSKYGGSPERSSRSHYRRDSRSPPRGTTYYNTQVHTKYKEDYTGYPQESGYNAQTGYSDEAEYRSRYPSNDHYGHRGYSGAPRTHRSGYGESNVYDDRYAEVVKLKVPLCCEACEERITNHMLALEGVESVTCDQLKQKVTVRGTASPAGILRQGKECFKQTTFWRS